MCYCAGPLFPSEHSINLLTLFWKNLFYSKGTCRGTSLGVCRGKCSQRTSLWYQSVQQYLWQHSHTCTLGRHHQPSSATSLDSFFQPLAVTCQTFWSSHLWLLRWNTLFTAFRFFVYISFWIRQMLVCDNIRTNECMSYTFYVQFHFLCWW